jgi:hypothetical protein
VPGVLVVFHQETYVIGLEDLVHGLEGFLCVGFVRGERGGVVCGGDGRLVVFLDVVDVGEPGELFPPADGFEDGHVLVVGVVPGAEGVEDVA